MSIAATLTIRNAQSIHAGTYSVSVRNSVDQVQSATVFLRVKANPNSPGNSSLRFITTSYSSTNTTFLAELFTNPATEVGLGQDSFFFTGLALSPLGELFAVNRSLYRIDTNGWRPVLATAIHISMTNNPLWRSIAFAPDGRLFGVVDKALYTISTNTGEASWVGTFPDGDFMWAIAFAPDGTLYGAEFDLYELNPANAQIIRKIGLIGSYFIVGLNVAADRNLYAVSSLVDGSALLRIDRNTFQTMILGEYPSKLDGLVSLSSPGDLGPSPGQPAITVLRVPGGLVLSWPTNFTLQASPVLLPPNSWSNVTAPPILRHGLNTLTVDRLTENEFFRLIKP